MLLLFLLGINIGIMSTIVANKTKLDKLNDVLKQAKNLKWTVKPSSTLTTYTTYNLTHKLEKITPT